MMCFVHGDVGFATCAILDVVVDLHPLLTAETDDIVEDDLSGGIGWAGLEVLHPVIAERVR
jgi:hypothetical protein